MNDNPIMGSDKQVVDAAEVKAKFLAAQDAYRTHLETGYIIDLFDSLPAEFQDQYKLRLLSASKNPSIVDFVKAIQGVGYEMSRFKLLLEQGKETVAAEGFNVANPQKLTYRTYYVEGGQPSKDIVISIDNDIGVVRGDKPFVYDTKLYPARDFGRIDEKKGKFETPGQNQMIKYNTAIEAGMIDGAAYEVRGRINKDFLGWMYGSAINQESPVPHVQVIYSLPLPSGAEYRFPLKRGSDPAKELQFINNDRNYTREDKSVIVGIERALRQQDKKLITQILSGANVDNPSEQLAPFLADPTKITDIALWREYSAKRLEGIWQAALSAHPPLYNEQNKQSAMDSQYAEPEAAKAAIRTIIEEQQRFLRSNPQIRKVKESYVLGDPGDGKYESNVAAVVENTYQKIASIRQHESAKFTADNAAAITEKRKQMGWRGLPEGIALDVDHIVMDAIIEVNQRQGQKGRSYEKPERFYSLAQVLDQLTPELDRGTKEYDIYDPLAEGHKCHVSINFTSQEAGKCTKKETEITNDNIVRAQKFVAELVTKKAASQLLDPEEKAIFRRSELGQRRLHNIESQTAGLKEQSKALGSQIAEATKTQNITQRDELKGELQNINVQVGELAKQKEQVYKEILGEKKWRETARSFKAKDQNLIKFIYVVTADEKPILSEERFNDIATGRAAHSELAGGNNVYAAGEIAFQKVGDKWTLSEINNGSGHYRPHESSLPYAKAVIEETIREIYKAEGKPAEQLEADVREFMNGVKLVDALARGRTIRDASIIFDDSVDNKSETPELEIKAGSIEEVRSSAQPSQEVKR